VNGTQCLVAYIACFHKQTNKPEIVAESILLHTEHYLHHKSGSTYVSFTRQNYNNIDGCRIIKGYRFNVCKKLKMHTQKQRNNTVLQPKLKAFISGNDKITQYLIAETKIS
jgi:hypothetical protein